MTNVITVDQIVALHQILIERFGGDPGLHDRGLIESAVAQPLMTFGGQDLYPTVVDKAVALGYSLIRNHGFKDGNKRIGFAALDVFLIAHGQKVLSTVDDMESVGLAVAAGTMSRCQLLDWVRHHIVPSDTRPV
jgi:death-on-curing protein